MKKINVQLLLDQADFDTLQAEADKACLTVPLYVKSRVLPEDGFGAAYRSLLARVAALPSGTRFDIKSLFGVDWTMSTRVKLNLGKTFNNRVKAGVITGVTPAGKDSSNVMWYRKD